MSNIIDDLGGPTAVARMAGVKPPSAHEWKRRGVIPAERCPLIERGTNGVHQVEQLRQDVRWARVPDALWPHPLGRPCIDPVGPLPLSSAANDGQGASHAA